MAFNMNSEIEIREAKGIRSLHFGSDWVQGAMRIKRPWDLELVYTREMMAALILLPSWPEMPRHVLQIGLGAASLTRFIYRHLPEARQVIVERSAAVVAAARQGFCLPLESDRLRIEVADGAQWMATAEEAFDLILVDGFDADGRSGDLESLAFYRHCRLRLAPGGLLVCNLLSRNPNFLQTCLVLDDAFDGHSRLLPPSPDGNVIAVSAAAKTVSLDEFVLNERVAYLEKHIGLDLKPLVERLLEQEDGLPFGV